MAATKNIHENTNYEKQLKKALAMVNRLVEAIEDMKYDCDGEVYEELLKINDVLAS